jgi:hypothetical protein
MSRAPWPPICGSDQGTLSGTESGLGTAVTRISGQDLAAKPNGISVLSQSEGYARKLALQVEIVRLNSKPPSKHLGCLAVPLLPLQRGG